MLCKLILVRERGAERKNWRESVKGDGGEYCQVDIYPGIDRTRRRSTLIAEAVEVDGKIKPKLLARLYDVQLLGLHRNMIALAGLEKLPNLGHGPDQYVAQTWNLLAVTNTEDDYGSKAPAAQVARHEMP